MRYIINARAGIFVPQLSTIFKIIDLKILTKTRPAFNGRVFYKKSNFFAFSRPDRTEPGSPFDNETGS